MNSISVFSKKFFHTVRYLLFISLIFKFLAWMFGWILRCTEAAQLLIFLQFGIMFDYV